MRAHHIDHGPGLAAPEASASLNPAGTASMAADAVATAGLNAQKASTRAAQATQSREQGGPVDFASAARADKDLQTLRAELALRGYGLFAADGGGYLVTRWNLSRHAADLDGIRHFLQRVAT